MVTVVPAVPPAGVRLYSEGAGTVKTRSLLLLIPLTATLTGPEAAVTGTVATIWLSLQLAIEDGGWPLNVSTLVPWEAPKPAPLTVTCVPTGPVYGDKVLTVRPGIV